MEFRTPPPSAPTMVKVYWPKGLGRFASGGWLVGWRFGEYGLCVAALVSYSVKASALQQVLGRLDLAQYSRMVLAIDVSDQDLPTSQPLILGTITAGENFQRNMSPAAKELKSASTLWLSMYATSQSDLPTLGALFHSSVVYPLIDIDFIVYQSSGFHEHLITSQTSARVPSRRNAPVAAEHGLIDVMLVYGGVRRGRHLDKHSQRRSNGGIHYAQSSGILIQTLKDQGVPIMDQRGPALNADWSKVVTTLIASMVYSSISITSNVIGVHRPILRLLRAVLTTQIAISGRAYSMTSIFATCRHVDRRLSKFFSLADQKNAKSEDISTTLLFFDFLSSYALDVVLGCVLGVWILGNVQWICEVSTFLIESRTLHNLDEMIDWLMGWPSGVKLNPELDRFLGELFLWLLEVWKSGVYGAMGIFLQPSVIGLAVLSCIGGVSIVLVVLVDAIRVLTLHVYCFYVIIAGIYSVQLNILYSLFALFRGKKRNVLRNRIDACDYELDQLLLGTIMFTVMAFLLPTVAVYYYYFASNRLGALLICALLDAIEASLTNLPLSSMALAIFRPGVISDGFEYSLAPNPPTAEHVLESSQGSRSAPTYILIKVATATLYTIPQTPT